MIKEEKDYLIRIKEHLRRRYHCIDIKIIDNVGWLTLSYSDIERGPVANIMFIPQTLINRIVTTRDTSHLNNIAFMREFFEAPIYAKREFVRQYNYLSGVAG